VIVKRREQESSDTFQIHRLGNIIGRWRNVDSIYERKRLWQQINKLSVLLAKCSKGQLKIQSIQQEEGLQTSLFLIKSIKVEET
jgi:hypothetical protein